MHESVGASQGDEFDLGMGNIAHGGYCVARLDGRVVFVRGALPGEEVRVRLTDISKASHWFGQAVDVISADSHRVVPPCPVAGECGGCDFQHVDVEFQRELKRRVVAEQLSRLAGIKWAGTVEAVTGSSDGLGWRTRMQYRSLNQRPALRRHRSHDLVQVPEGGCPIAHPAGRPAAEAACNTAEHAIVMVTSCLSEDPEVSVIADGQLVAGGETMTARVGQRRWKVGAGGFWQVHPGAAEALADAVIGSLEPQQGDEALDLYCGVGLFAGLLADRGVRVRGVEVSRQAVALARAMCRAAVSPLAAWSECYLGWRLKRTLWCWIRHARVLGKLSSRLWLGLRLGRSLMSPVTRPPWLAICTCSTSTGICLDQSVLLTSSR